MATTPQFVGAANTGTARFIDSDGTSLKTIWTPGSAGGRVETITITSTVQGASPALVLYLTKGGVAYRIGRYILSPATSDYPQTTITLGESSKASVDFALVGSLLAAGAVLQVGFESALPSTYAVDVVVFGGDF